MKEKQHGTWASLIAVESYKSIHEARSTILTKRQLQRQSIPLAQEKALLHFKSQSSAPAVHILLATDPAVPHHSASVKSCAPWQPQKHCLLQASQSLVAPPAHQFMNQVSHVQWAVHAGHHTR